jgi:fibronectin-binding autotransporter adhesin
LGGAIYLDQGGATVRATSGDVVFSGNRQLVTFTSGVPNRTTGSPNAIYFNNLTNNPALGVTFDAAAGATITFHDPIADRDAAGRLAVTKAGAGTLLFTGVQADGVTPTAGAQSLVNAVTTVAAGTFQLDNGASYGRSATVSGTSFTVNTGATLATSGTRIPTPASIHAAAIGLGAGSFLNLAASLTLNGGAIAFDRVTTTARATSTLATGVGQQIGLAGTNTFDVTAGVTLAVPALLSGGGSVLKTNSGTMVLTASNTFTGGTTISGGTLQIGDDGTTGSVVGDIVDHGALVFNRRDAVTFGGIVSGTGSLTQAGSGTLTLSGVNTYAGATVVNAGTLLINGNQTLARGAVSVASGTTLGGAGTTGGLVTVADGGHLVGGQGQTFTMDTLVLNPTTQIDVSLANPSTSGLFRVNGNGGGTGNLELDGVLNITAAGAFGPGVYRLIDYTGTLTDNGLAFGTVPGGFTPNVDLFVQTSVAQQVNLAHALGAGPLTFWDGNDSGLYNNSSVNGGSGTWLAAPANLAWTDSSGVVNARWQDDGFAVFQGTPGPIRVSNASGAVTFSGAQFAVHGYTIAGDPLTTGTANSVMCVGDGTRVGATMTATIDAVIQGSGGINKTDLGTLVLTGNNTYAGGTTITNGTLQLGNGGVTGSVLGNIANNAALAFNRSDTVTFGGTISGTGMLAQIGTGTTILTNANTYSGGTRISAGTLVATDVAALGTGEVRNDAALIFNIDGAHSGVVINRLSGSGRLTKALGGSVTLTASGSEAGEVLVEAGQLVLGQSGAFRTTRGGFRVADDAEAVLTESASLLVNTAFTVDNTGTLTVELTPTTSAAKVTAASANLGDDSTLNVIGYLAGPVERASQLPDVAHTVIHTTGGISGDFAHVNFLGANLPDYLSASAGKDATGLDYNLRLGLRWLERLPLSHGTFTLGDGAAFDVDVPLHNMTPNGATGWDGRTLTKQGPGMLTLSALNTYSGLTGIGDGTVALAGAGDIAASGGVLLAAPTATFTITQADGHRTIQDLMGVAGSTVVLGGNTLTAGTARSTIFAGAITGAGGLTKQGTGAMVLNGISSYTGTTEVREGALIVGDADHRDAALTGGGLVTVRPGAIFGGYGSVAGDVVNQGLAPGAVGLAASSPGVVAVGTFASGALRAADETGAVFDIRGTLRNAGVVEVGASGFFGDMLVAGSYVGQQGVVRLHTRLGDDNAPSDRLVIDGGTATGTTSLIFLPSGDGALTSGDGIPIVVARRGATTASDAFFTTSEISTPLYDYALHRGGLGLSNPESWFLRSTYRAELSLYAAAPLFAGLYGRALLDTLHERVGDEERLRGRTDLGDTRWLNGVWGRVLARNGDWDGGGLIAKGPPVDYDLWAVQGGVDLIRGEHDNGSRVHGGLHGASGRISGTATSDAGEEAGDVELDVQTLGGYFTYFGGPGWYVDGLAQFSWLEAKMTSPRTGIRPEGTTVGTSIEAGYPFAVGEHTRLEPQAQLVYHGITFDSSADAFAPVRFDDTTSLAARFGGRVSQTWRATTPRPMTTWARLSVWHDFQGDSAVEIGGLSAFTPVTVDFGGGWMEFGLGGDIPLSRLFTVFGSGTYSFGIEDSDLSAVTGRGGLRVNW